MKKSLSIILAAVIVFLAIPTLGLPAYADYNEFSFEITADGDAIVTGYTGTATAVTIPNKLGNATVKIIGPNAFSNKSTITSIKMPNTVVTIQDHAFASCSSLASVEFSDELQSIGLSAFMSCHALTSIKIPKSVTSIGNYAFAQTNLTNCILPYSVTSLGEYVFNNCYYLQSVTLPEITKIPRCAFLNCSSLIYVSVPASVTTVGEYAFSGCTSYNELSWLNRNITIEKSAFKSCNSIKQLYLDSNINVNIKLYAFQNCANLDNVRLPNGTSIIEEGAFNGCHNLKYVQIGYDIHGGTTSEIGKGAFAGCANLHMLIILNNVNKINFGAFAYCTNLTTVEIYGNVNRFENNAFCNTTNLTYFSYMGSTPQYLGVNVFYNNGYYTPNGVAYNISSDNAIAGTGTWHAECYSCGNYNLDTSMIPYGMNSVIGVYRSGTNDVSGLSPDDQVLYDRAKQLIINLGIPANASYGTKILTIYNWMTSYVRYDENHSAPGKDDAYGCIVNNLCECDGFSNGFKLMMEMLGVTCINVGGIAPNAESGHVWNMVKLFNDWYHIDVTFDANPGIPVYTYFMKLDSEFYVPANIDRNTHSQYSIHHNSFPATPTTATASYYRSSANIVNYDGGSTHSHSFNLAATGNTCETVGYTYYTCSCGCHFWGNFTMPVGHTGGTATCASRAVCTRCNNNYGGLNLNHHTFVQGVCTGDNCGIKIGDLNFDGLFNGKDGNMMQSLIAGDRNYTYSIVEAMSTGIIYFYVADINQDGLINGKDGNLMNQIIVGDYHFS